MARRNNSRKLPARPFNAPMVGDPAPARAKPLSDKELLISLLNDESQLDGMSDEEIFNTALRLGIKATELLKVDHCYEHVDMKAMYGQPLSRLNWATDVRWCSNCFNYFRSKTLKGNDV